MQIEGKPYPNMNKAVLFFTAAALPLLAIPSTGVCGSDGLEGRWKIVAVPAGWKKVPGTNVVISSGVIRVCVGKLTTTVLSYTADPATGKVEAARKVKGKTVVQRGIYRQTGNLLMLSVGAEGKPAPSSPESTEGGAMRWVFRRA
jgi:hypothetical protein